MKYLANIVIFSLIISKKGNVLQKMKIYNFKESKFIIICTLKAEKTVESVDFNFSTFE